MAFHDSAGSPTWMCCKNMPFGLPTETATQASDTRRWYVFPTPKLHDADGYVKMGSGANIGKSTSLGEWMARHPIYDGRQALRRTVETIRVRWLVSVNRCYTTE